MCHPEGPGQTGGMGQQEPYRVQDGQMQSPASRNKHLQRYRLGNRLPREAAESLCLELFKARLNKALSNLV